MNLFINKKIWKEFSEEEHTKYINDVFNHYREHGFPYFPTDSTFRQKEFNKLISYDDSKLIEDGIIKQTMHGLSLAWSYMPHSWSVECNNLKTPLEVFNDDTAFKKVIEKRMKMGDNMSDNGIRKMLKMYSGTQSVSNFRPTAASAIYQKYTNTGNTVLDMSSGFGGRLLGAVKAGVNYIGYEPSTKTYDGLQQMKKDFCDSHINSIIHCCGSEDMELEKETIDFAFTSPPYFDTEKYADEATQSYVKYPTKDEWISGFLLETFKRTHLALKPNKYMLINIANTKRFVDIEEHTIFTAEQAGFILEDTLRLALSNSNFKNRDSAFKYEPVFVFKKQ